jgi:hypothetical protein
MSAIIKIAVLANAANAIKGFRETSTAASTMGTKVSGGARQLAGLTAGAIGIGSLVGAFKTGADEAARFQDAALQTTAALKTNANLHGLTAAQVQKSSAALETLTGAKIDENDATLAADKLIRAGVTTQAGLQNALKASADVALGTGKDIGTVSTAVSKALADPSKAQGVLAKAGIILSGAQKSAIDAMLKSGNVAGAQAAVISGLESKYKGASEAAGKGFSADIGRAKDALADSERDIVSAVLPTLGKLAKSFSADLPGAIAVVKPVLSALWTVVSNPVFLTVAATIGAIVVAMKIWALGVKAVSFAQEIWAAGTKVVAAAQWLLNAALDANPIGLIIIGVVALVAGIVWLATKTQFFQTIWAGTWSLLKTVGAWFAGPFAGFFVNTWRKITDAFSAGVDWIKNAFNSVVSWIAAIPGRIERVGRDLMAGLVRGIQAGIQWVKDKIAALGRLIPEGLRSLLGIHSPSVVMHGLGTNIMRGLAAGIGSQVPVLKRQLGAVADTITGLSARPTVTLAASAAVPVTGGRAGGGNAYTVNVTVAPTADRAAIGREILSAIAAAERRSARTLLVPAL